MWDLPGPGIEPVSPALAGGFLTTAPPGKPPDSTFLKKTLEFFKNVYVLKIKTYKLKNYIQKNTSQDYSKVAASLQ